MPILSGVEFVVRADRPLAPAVVRALVDEIRKTAPTDPKVVKV